MPPTFDDATTTGVLHHMNSDHSDDNLLIVRAFGCPEATGAVMTGFDGDGGSWDASLPNGGRRSVVVPWPSGAITARPEVRREIVALYDQACRALGIEPRPH